MSAGKSRSCLICGIREIKALVRVDLCREHLSIFQGGSPVENHHPEGRAASSDVVPLPINIHAVLTAKQIHWPGVLHYPSKDPLIQIARRIQATQDFIEYLHQAARRDANFLLALSLAQQEIHGLGWWKRGQVAPLNVENSDG